MTETAILWCALPASSMKVLARLDKRASPNTYQRAVWVSATPTTVRNLRRIRGTSRVGFRQFPQQMGRVHTLPRSHTTICTAPDAVPVPPPDPQFSGTMLRERDLP